MVMTKEKRARIRAATAAWKLSKKGRQHKPTTLTTETYGTRDRLLVNLGYTSYSNYLNSDLWASIRINSFQSHGRDCFLCGRRANTIHHISYSASTLTGEDISQLAPLCFGCHRAVEFTCCGNKRMLGEAQARYTTLRGRHLRRLGHKK